MNDRDDKPGPFEFGSGHPATVSSTRRSYRTWIIVLFVVLCAAAGTAYFYYFDRDRATRLLRDTPFAPAPVVTTVYKWQDAQGNWHITDQPPPAGTTYETLEYSSDSNVMPLVPRDDR